MEKANWGPLKMDQGKAPRRKLVALKAGPIRARLQLRSPSRGQFPRLANAKGFPLFGVTKEGVPSNQARPFLEKPSRGKSGATSRVTH